MGKKMQVNGLVPQKGSRNKERWKAEKLRKEWRGKRNLELSSWVSEVEGEAISLGPNSPQASVCCMNAACCRLLRQTVGEGILRYAVLDFCVGALGNQEITSSLCGSDKRKLYIRLIQNLCSVMVHDHKPNLTTFFFLLWVKCACTSLLIFFLFCLHDFSTVSFFGY